MKKINTKGFALVETLIVSAFVVSIFTIMYTNFYPIMGEYEKRENYDDIGLLYSSNLFKGLIEKNKSYSNMNQKINSVIRSTSPLAYVELTQTDFNPSDYTSGNNSSRDCFNVLVKNAEVDTIYLTSYKISILKNANLDVQTKDYINSLPNYSNSNPGSLGCRIIVKYKSEGNRESNKNKDNDYRYSTIGVGCN